MITLSLIHDDCQAMDNELPRGRQPATKPSAKRWRFWPGMRCDQAFEASADGPQRDQAKQLRVSERCYGAGSVEGMMAARWPI